MKAHSVLMMLCMCGQAEDHLLTEGDREQFLEAGVIWKCSRCGNNIGIPPKKIVDHIYDVDNDLFYMIKSGVLFLGDLLLCPGFVFDSLDGIEKKKEKLEEQEKAGKKPTCKKTEK